MIIGIDIGTRADHTAIVGLDGWTITYIEKLPLGLEYPEIINRLEGLISPSDQVFLDASGVGDPVCSTLQAKGLPVTGIRITGGKKGKCFGSIWTVPKSLLLNALMQSVTRGQLKINADNRHLLKDEMLSFLAKGEAKAGQHDDIVLAACLAVFGCVSIRTDMRSPCTIP